MPVSRLAKWKTAMQLVCLGFLIAGPAGDAILPTDWTRLVGLALLWVAAVLTLLTGYDYMKASIRHLVEEDSAA